MTTCGFRRNVLMQTTIAPMYPHCFVCGSENPNGLRVAFGPGPDGGCRAEYTPTADHVGWPDIVHGGLVFTLMDEALAWALCCAGMQGVTAKAEARFRQQVRVGDRLVVTGRVLERRRKVVRARAEVRRADNPDDLVAELEGTMFLADVG
jgi:acyl-coenzyme A thioesterase PaaI-like protein